MMNYEDDDFRRASSRYTETVLNSRLLIKSGQKIENFRPKVIVELGNWRGNSKLKVNSFLNWENLENSAEI